MKNNIDFKQRVDQFKWSKGLLALVSLLVLTVTTTYGQLEAGYSMYRFNPQVISPAHTGSTATSDVTLMNRQQWLGFEGAPKTYMFSGNFKFGAQSGLGVNAMQDQSGVIKISTFSADYAYHTKLSEEWTFSGGIRAGLANLNVSSDLNLVNQGDPSFIDRSLTKFNTGWGLKIANGDGFFVSVSQPRVLKYDLGPDFIDPPFFYGMVGTKIKANQNVTIYPSALIRTASGVPVSWDANVLVNLAGKFDIGANYRNQDSWGIRVGVQGTKNIYLGYVFEMPTSQLSLVDVQTHEIALRYSFGK